jgi:hypothetical protein
VVRTQASLTVTSAGLTCAAADKPRKVLKIAQKMALDDVFTALTAINLIVFFIMIPLD